NASGANGTELVSHGRLVYSCGRYICGCALARLDAAEILPASSRLATSTISIEQRCCIPTPCTGQRPMISELSKVLTFIGTAETILCPGIIANTHRNSTMVAKGRKPEHRAFVLRRSSLVVYAYTVTPICSSSCGRS